MGKTSDYQELVEIELSASGVDRFVKTFDYSDQEWAEIELSAQPARTGPLTEDVRQCMRQAGVVYLILHSIGREFLKQQELTFVANREKICGLSAELYEQLGEANARSTDDMKYRWLLKSLAKLRDDASILSARSPQLSPREDYYHKIFGVWVDKLGGRLGVSRDEDTHKLGGPLVRFFQAVTRPVLATEAPALESISRIVDREKERRKERRKRGGRSPAQMAGSVEVPARRPDAGGNYTDLGPFRTDPNIPFDMQVHDYVVERGRATGVQHIVAVDADGTVLAHGFGKHNGFVVLPKKLADALHDPANKIVIHRYNPSHTDLNAVDISNLALPGLEAIWKYGNGGNVARVALTPEGRAMLRGNTLEKALVKLLLIAHGIGSRLFDALEDAIRARNISVDQANMAYSHLVADTLCRAGILDYRSDVKRRRVRRA